MVSFTWRDGIGEGAPAEVDHHPHAGGEGESFEEFEELGFGHDWLREETLPAPLPINGEGRQKGESGGRSFATTTTNPHRGIGSFPAISPPNDFVRAVPAGIPPRRAQLMSP
jgi:hypothetical protein